MIVGGIYGLHELLAADGAGFLGDITFGRAGGHVLLHALTAWFAYLAIEPYVRRVWPHMLVGWVRLLSGRLMDPSVGREILTGIFGAQVLRLLVHILLLTPFWIHGGQRGVLAPQETLDATTSLATYVAAKVHITAWAIMLTFLIAGLLVAARLLTRNVWAAIVVGIVVIGGTPASGIWSTDLYSAWQIATVGIVCGTAVVLIITRVGLVAATSMSMGTMVFTSIGMFRSDFGGWLAPFGVAEAAIVIVIAGYGFWVSLAGQPIFKDMLAEAEPKGRAFR